MSARNNRIGALLDDRSLPVKILSAVVVSLIATVGITWISVASMKSIRTTSQHAANVALSAQGALADFQAAAVGVTGDSLAAQIPAYSNAGKSSMVVDLKAASDAVVKLTNIMAGTPGESVAAQLAASWKDSVAFNNETHAPKSAAEGQAIVVEYNDLVAKQHAAAQATKDYVAKLIADTTKQSKDAQNRAIRNVLLALIASAIVSLGLAWLVASRTRRNLGALGVVVDALAAGDLTKRTGLDCKDEVGTMAKALDKAGVQLQQDFSLVASNARDLSAASGRLISVAATAAGSVEEASVKYEQVAENAQAVSSDVHTIATAGEQMAASIREISTNSSEATQFASHAVEVVESTNATVTRLGVSSSQIGDVVKVITTIAAQTNLLALNATIEAARAGDAGKGFAVVAGEVKDLARETAKATEDITRRVQAIQADTTGAVQAIAEIGEIIENINRFQLTIASAVEEQSATTDAINSTLNSTANQSGQIASNISDIAAATQQTASVVAETNAAARNLSEMSAQLDTLVGRFQFSDNAK
ncbi:methyl-accepting chemotaxis protein [Jatrophihabitans sp. GAS493]|uniref:methyl-accepting chemotaxis protein n=1 Tax=Jatrophihabitans sp. GAS493 TaxID=1907575 RepID=UPI000BB6F222|nr:HAMP domain-containing methyl-accepting chemotaxis protein [Jatrophihabitans sp. GAS493]SOD74761.1 methyl-accepting chemotaxis protein [Jatrophihabitans sp. GAS493]